MRAVLVNQFKLLRRVASAAIRTRAHSMADTKPKVFITRASVPQAAVKLLKDKCTVVQWPESAVIDRASLLLGAADADALFCLLTETIDKELLDSCQKLKVIGTMSVGYDHIDVGECKKRGILLGYTPNVLTEATAELTVALLLATARRLLEAHNAVLKGEWGHWDPLWMCGRGIAGSIVGFLGLGRIGLSVAEKLKTFKPKEILYATQSQMTKPEADSLGAKLVSFEELLANSDFLIITCSLNDRSRHIIDKSAFDKMKSSAILINSSRGPIVDQEALFNALKDKRISAAGLDVCVPEPLPPSDKLLQLPNLVLLPHIGSATLESRTRMATLTAENILAGLEGQKMPAAIY